MFNIPIAWVIFFPLEQSNFCSCSLEMVSTDLSECTVVWLSNSPNCKVSQISAEILWSAYRCLWEGGKIGACRRKQKTRFKVC